MSGNVSRALQTRKITKICTAFLIIHYNRDSNTNWTPAAPRYSGFVLTLLSRCTENDLLQKLLGVRQIPASSVRTRTYVNFLPELIAGHKPSREISGHQHSQQILMICNKYQDILPSLRGADHMPERTSVVHLPQHQHSRDEFPTVDVG